MRIEQYIKIYNEFYSKCCETLDTYLFQYIEISGDKKANIEGVLIAIIEEDISALITGDPAAKRNTRYLHDVNPDSKVYVLDSYKPLESVIMYRIASFIYRYCTEYLDENEFNQDNLTDINELLQTQARKLSEQAKANTGVEIHPAAKIGRRFVIDHGYGTVIGETSEIGEGCYILQGVTLGAGKIKDNEPGRRHPKLGNNVQVAGFARIFGAIEIGNDSVICGYAVIDRDIPPGSKVRIVNQIQVVSPNNHSIVVYGVRPNQYKIEIFGRNLNLCDSITLLDEKGNPIHSIDISFTKQEDSLLICFHKIENIVNAEKVENYIISINIENEAILIQNSIGWCDFINKLKK